MYASLLSLLERTEDSGCSFTLALRQNTLGHNKNQKFNLGF
jgi:hypothetical protein